MSCMLNTFLFHHTPSGCSADYSPPSIASESWDLVALYKLVFNLNCNFTSSGDSADSSEHKARCWVMQARWVSVSVVCDSVQTAAAASSTCIEYCALGNLVANAQKR